MVGIDLSFPIWMLDLDEYQDRALQKTLDWYRSGKKQTFALGGHAGCGKTTLIRVLLKEIPGALVCAYTGKAVHVLHQKGIDHACTLHRLLYNCVGKTKEGKLIFEPKPPGSVSAPLVIVDEASMVSRELARDLLMHRVPVLWVGDHGQLEPIGSGSVSLVKNPDVRLEHIHRQAEHSGIIRFAHHLREGKKPYAWDGSNFRDVEICEPASFDLERAADFDVILCGTNEKRIEVNKLMRKMVDSEIPQSGEPLVILRNNYEYGVFNGQIVTVVEAKLARPYYHIKFVTDGFSEELEGRFLIDQFHNPEVQVKAARSVLLADFGYALTGHKSQGSEWDAVLVLEESVFSGPRWRYTTATRASRHLVYVPCENNVLARAKASTGGMARMLARKKDGYVSDRAKAKKKPAALKGAGIDLMRKRAKKLTSTTTVVNMRTAPFDVYIGRAGHGHDGYFGNPIRVGSRCSICGDIHLKPGQTIKCFKQYFHKRLKADPEFARRVESLRGKRLGCFCKPKRCHGDVIAAHLNEGSQGPAAD
jgi:exodeoxyribonuclease-5